jgi:serine/threonine protein kinase/Tol biopolymer transport system component
MDPSSLERWPEIDRLLDQALDLAPEQRAAFLERTCSAEPALLPEVERLLRAVESAESFLGEPASVYAAPLVAWVAARQELAPGTHFGAYEVVRRLGRGGMATVYLAQDHKHHRAVAIKVLHPELAAAVGPERFLREIEIAAALHHPHILPLYDSGITDGLLYYVMPYIEGESLRQRLTREEHLANEEAIRIVRDVAAALDYAHRQGVVHRDIKPENILLQDGQAIVADFGIARAVDVAGGERLTAPGRGIGTPAYMSPEQASTHAVVDGRADIYALGCVLYEMLAGQPPFTGRSQQQILARHAVDPVPSLHTVRQTVPPPVERAVMCALAKLPADRFATADLFARALTTSDAESVPESRPQPAASGNAGSRARLRPWALVVGLLSIAAAVGIAAIVYRRPEETRLGRRTPVTLEPGLEIDPAISPDGRLLAYAAGPTAELRVYVRQLGGGTPIPLAPDLGRPQRFPLWSPDGKRILFRSPRGLEVIPVLGGVSKLVVPELGPPLRSAPSPPWVGGAALMPGGWSPDGREFAYVRFDSLYVEALEDGVSRLVVQGGVIHSPVWSPDGRWIAFARGNRESLEPGLRFGNVGVSTLWLVGVAGGEPVLVTDQRSSSASPTWLPGGRALLFVSNREGGRDIYRVALSRSGTPASTSTRLTTGLNAQAISLSADGRRLAYSVFSESSNIWSLPIPAGMPVSVSQARPVTGGNQVIEGFDLSPDARWLAFDTDRSGNPDIYRVPVAGGEPEQLTTDPGDDFGPAWSPDGREIAFHSFRMGVRQIFVMSADGRQRVQVTTGSDDERSPVWTRDGHAILFSHNLNRPNQDLRIISRDQAGRWGQPRTIMPGDVSQMAVSPDGNQTTLLSRRGLTLTTARGEAPRILVPVSDPTSQVRPNYAEWSSDGRDIYYLALDSADRASIWSVARTGGPPSLLVRFDDSLREWHRYGFRARGGRFYFTLGDRQSDIWTAEVELGH